MHTHKVIIALAAAALMAAGCMNMGSVNDELIADLRQELAEANADRTAIQDQYIQQNKEMSAILDELAAISGKTASLRLDVENGSARMTQADRIADGLDGIKARISALEKSNAVMAGKNKEFGKMIEGFNKVIEEQENQIISLRKEIQSRELTILAQKDTISTHRQTISAQNQTIADQQEELRRTVMRQAQMLCEAGEVLESIADNTPEVSWRRNREKVAAQAQDIYAKALSYYRKAAEAGYAPAEAKAEAVSAKLR